MMSASCCLVSIRNYIALKLKHYLVKRLESLVSIRNYIALKRNGRKNFILLRLVSIRNYIALKHNNAFEAYSNKFSIHTKLHRSKTIASAVRAV